MLVNTAFLVSMSASFCQVAAFHYCYVAILAARQSEQGADFRQCESQRFRTANQR